MNKNYEKIGIKISMIGGIMLSLSAIIMALIVDSQAILFDGLYTIVTLFMAFFSLKVVDLVERPETKQMPFGYMALEPFLNFIKCLIILTLLIFFLITNIQELCTGGRVISLNMTIIYIFICLIIYINIIILLKKCGKKSDSSILRLEIKNWYIDTLLTLGIAVSLVVALIFLKLGYTQILPYIDPTVVILLVIVSLPVPLKVFIVELRKLLLISSENKLESEVIKMIQPAIDKYDLIDIQVWGLKSGRMNYFFIFLDLDKDQVTVNYLDEIRKAICSELSKTFPKFWADIIFTKINPDKSFSFDNYAREQAFKR